ncbi:Gfo/Idh/MocA family oxidoreductase [Ruminococcaceae bacterium OttesenSCG-928-L11]|nr:Gfo/Idh/MocA family oxidoreductase [Ruminococcaceae bacterium OttesenSCG-928-L11]
MCASANGKIRVGIVGTGFTIGIALSHFRGYEKCEDADVVAAYDCIPGRAALFLEKHSIEGVKACETLEELFDMVDAVSLCVPNVEHPGLAIKALEAGKHVLLEKPFAVSCAEGQKALDAANAHPDLVSMTCMNYRDGAPIQYMKHIIDSGKLGPIRFVRQSGGGGRIADPEKVFLEWRMQEKTSGTGSLADFGIHMLDLVHYLLHDQCGDYVSYSAQTATHIQERYLIDPASVSGDKAGAEKAPVTNDDTASFSAISESGAMFVYNTSRVNFAGADFEIVGENGAICNSSKYPPGTLGMMIKGETLTGYDKPSFFMQPVTIPEEYTKTYTSGLSHDGITREFIHCIKTGTKSDRDFAHGMYLQTVIDTFSTAAKEGRIIKV